MDFLYRDCGLKGLSGISNDVRELQRLHWIISAIVWGCHAGRGSGRGRRVRFHCRDRREFRSYPRAHCGPARLKTLGVSTRSVEFKAKWDEATEAGTDFPEDVATERAICRQP
jgi:hypothetical protein